MCEYTGVYKFLCIHVQIKFEIREEHKSIYLEILCLRPRPASNINIIYVSSALKYPPYIYIRLSLCLNLIKHKSFSHCKRL